MKPDYITYTKCNKCRHIQETHTDKGCDFLYYDEVKGSRRCNCLEFFKEKESKQRKRKDNLLTELKRRVEVLS